MRGAIMLYLWRLCFPHWAKQMATLARHGMIKPTNELLRYGGIYTLPVPLAARVGGETASTYIHARTFHSKPNKQTVMLSKKKRDAIHGHGKQKKENRKRENK